MPKSLRNEQFIEQSPSPSSSAPKGSGYLSPKAEGGRVGHSAFNGVFATAEIARGELIAVWGGDIVTRETVKAYQSDLLRLTLQVEEDLFLVSTIEGASDWVNHSCAPNSGLRGQTALVALRDISAGEEICFDYAMSDGSDYDEFSCQCGATQCRGLVTGDDWRRNELWLAYGAHFSPYLLRRIDLLKKEQRKAASRPERRSSKVRTNITDLPLPRGASTILAQVPQRTRSRAR